MNFDTQKFPSNKYYGSYILPIIFCNVSILDHLILHLEFHVQALECVGLPSSMSGSAPAISVPYAADHGRVSVLIS